MFQNRHRGDSGERLVRSARDMGEEIARARRAQGLLQADLAEISHVERSRLAKIEAGKSTKLIDQLRLLTDLLGLEIVIRERDPHRGGIE